MTLGTLLDVALVLCAIYVALSCICSWTTEQIAAVLRLRGKNLFDGIMNLLAHDSALTEAIYAHPLVTGAANYGWLRQRAATLAVGKQAAAPGTESTTLPSPVRPSYIDPRNFTMALWSEVGTPAADGAPSLTATPEQLFADAAARVQSLGDDSGLKGSLTALLAQASGSYATLLTVTDAWFNAQMDRVSGWYRRRSQYIAVVIAAAVVLGTGVDSIDVAKRTATMDPTYRSAMIDDVAAATRHADGTVAKPEDIRSAVALHVDCTNKPAAAAANDTSVEAALHACPGPIVSVWSDARAWSFGRVAGLALTIVALSLGGPFWFDLLCSLVNVRMSGNRPKKGVKAK